MLRKSLLAFLCALAGSLFTPVAARAAHEFCPADVYRIQTFGADTQRVTAVQLYAHSQRSLHGTIEFVTTDGRWFTAPFPETTLAVDTERVRTKYSEFDRTQYLSPPIYIKTFGSINLLWVSDARTQGETLFNWDAEGDVHCPAPPGQEWQPAPEALQELRVNPLPAINAPSTALSLIEATAMKPPSLACAVPAAYPTPDKLATPEFPEIDGTYTLPQVVTVELALDADGKIIDATVYDPSGLPAVDDAAVAAAKASTFLPGRALCQNVPGNYLFEAEFEYQAPQ